jgi:hypothetical protein
MNLRPTVPKNLAFLRAESALVVFAFPFGVGALEVFYAVFFEVPESCGYFVGGRVARWVARAGIVDFSPYGR